MTNDSDKKALYEAALRKAALTIETQKAKLNTYESEIAIIGMGCRFPGGANNPKGYWDLLHNGSDAIVEIPPNRWDPNDYYDPDPKAPGKMITKFGGFLNVDVSEFDAEFFGISRKEAEYLDPQQRLLLEVNYEAIQSAGIDPRSLKGSLTGVFIGVCSHDYMDLLIGTGDKNLINPYIATGNVASTATGRISFFLGLRGPNFAVDTACSSSLVAIDQACKSLRNGEANLALAGGVNLILAPDLSIDFSKAGMLAPDGHCKTFDASADGYVRGEGCGIIVLKRLTDAERDGNTILAIIKSSGINQDGASGGLTVPNGDAQEALILSVLNKAKLNGADIDYVEAHGTGTSLGDPIEVRAIGAALGERDASNPLKLASVKTNIGHLEGAAGVAGVIKVVLAMQHETLPKNLHFKKLNPHIEMNFPAEIIRENKEWKRGTRIRRAAVSAFGFSGTNAHLILEEGPALSEMEHVKLQERLSHLPDFKRRRYWAAALTHPGKRLSEKLISPDEEVIVQSELPLKNTIIEQVRSILGLLPSETLDEKRDFFEIGMDSLMATALRNNLQMNLSLNLPVSVVFDHPSVDKLVNYIFDSNEKMSQKPESELDKIKKLSLEVEKNYPASPMQKRLCFLYRLRPEAVNYNLGVFAELLGNLNEAVLQNALDQFFENNAILRTRFSFEDGQVFQVVHETKRVDVVKLDFSQFSTDEQRKLIEAFNNENREKPFNLEKGPLIRLSLIKLEEQKSLFHVYAHHVIIDGLALQKFFLQLFRAYALLLESTKNILPKPSVQYVEYADFLDRQEESQKYRDQMNYWLLKLKDAPRIIQLPTDYIRTQDTTYRGATYRFDIAAGLKQETDLFAQKIKKTPFLVFLTVYAILLHKYSGDAEINIGTYSSDREISEAEDLVGMFVNTLVIRTNVKKNLNYLEFLEEEFLVVREALSNQCVPFENVVDHLNLERDLSRNALVQVNFNFLPNLLKPFQEGGLAITLTNSDFPRGEFDWSFEMITHNEHYEVYFQYNANLFKEESIKNAAAQFEEILRAVIHSPDKLISDLSLLTPSETKFILEDLNPQPKVYPLDKTVASLFEESVFKFPAKIAVTFGEESLSYKILNERANQLANYLLSLSVKPEEPIGVCLTRGIEMLVAVLAILKSGASYIPLDPTFPVHRLAYMLENSELSILITTQELQTLFPKFDRQFILIDKEKSVIEVASKENPKISIDPRQLAYTIYTSGSTGNPKGVQIEHRSLTNFLFSMQERPGVIESDLLLAVTTLSFDIATLELYLPLITGASVVIAPETSKQDVFELQELMKKHKVSIMQATPTTWQMLFESGWKGDPNLVVLCGGEALKQDLAKKLASSCKALWNMYGPTETTVWSSLEKIDQGAEPITVGKPIANTSFYILDEDRHPVPMGLMGKLYIGGLGVARGYLKRPELTAEKFIQNPFKQSAEERIYDTGDLARYLPDGRVECLGRADYQVKVRGFRLELGDIESHLSELEEIKDAVVILLDERLVAYIIPSQSINIEDLNQEQKLSELLRNKLKKELPSYMIPAAFVTLDAFPLTPNKKIDRKALPKPELILTGEHYIAPRDETENKLASIWETLLGRQPISMTADYFELGGNSLLSISLISRVNKAFNLDLPLAFVFNYSTIQTMAQAINAKQPESLKSLVHIHRENAEAPIVLIHPIGGNIACYKTLAKHLGAEHAIYALQHPGVYSDKLQHETLMSLAEYYASELHQENPKGKVSLVGWSFGGVLAYEIARFFELWGHPVSKLFLIDTFTPALFRNDIFPETRSSEKLLWYFVQDYLGTNANQNMTESEFLHLLGDKLDVNSALKLITSQQFTNEDLSIIERSYQIFVDNLIMYWSCDLLPTELPTILISSSQFQQFPTRGWDLFCKGSIKVEKISTDHFGLMREPAVKQVTDIIRLNIKRGA